MSGIMCANGRTTHRSRDTQAKCRECRAAMGNGRKQATTSASLATAAPTRSAAPSGVTLENKKGGFIKLGANQRPDSVGGEIINSSGADLFVDDTYLEEGTITHADESSRDSEIRGSEMVRSELRVSDGADVAYSYLTDVDVTVSGGGLYDSTIEGNSGEEKVALSKSTVESTLINDSVSFAGVNVYDPKVYGGTREGERLTIEGHSVHTDRDPIITDTTPAGIGTYSAGAGSRVDECQIEVDGYMSIDDNVQLIASKLDIREGCSAQINNIFLDEEMFVAKDVRVVGHNKDHSVALLAHHDSRHPNSVYIHEGGATHRFKPTAKGNYVHDRSFGESPFEGIASKNRGYMRELAHAARRYNSSIKG